MPLVDPITQDVLLALGAFHRVFWFACIAGSAALARHMAEVEKATDPSDRTPGFSLALTRMESGGIDVFVPAAPRMVYQDMRMGYESTTGDAFLDYMMLVERRAQYSKLQYEWERAFEGLKFQSVVQIMEEEHGLICRHHSLSHPSQFHQTNIVGLYEFFVRSPSTAEETKLRVFVVNILMRPHHTWLQTIVNDFDMDICMCGIEFRNTFDLNCAISHATPASRHAVLQGEFNFVVKPGIPFMKLLARMHKYKNRGFRLAKMSFHPDCDKHYKAYINSRFQHLYAPSICKLTLIKNGLSNMEAHGIANEHMIPHFDLPTQMKLSKWECEVCGDNAGWAIHRRSAMHQDTINPITQAEMENHFDHKLRDAAANKIARWLKPAWLQWLAGSGTANE